MATRSRTLLFLQYRNSYARTQGSAPHFSAGLSETEGLIESSDNVIEMSVLPPKWWIFETWSIETNSLFLFIIFFFFLPRRVDIVDEVDEALDVVKDKSKI